ncbi:MAG: dienelactone hydrolase family protein [Polyangiaceae bacterium]|nr:dienelactone hydrolase family protein [Polyangiaceae bacterium]
MTTEIEGFSCAPFTYEGKTRDVYRKGQGPAVIVMTEIPGITPAVIRFAERVVADGFTVFMPHFFGEPGKAFSPTYSMSQIARVCISKEFHVLAARGSSPVTHWLRALCRHAHEECKGPGVGAIGMCMTGNFALSLMVDPSVMAPVLSQPSLPFGVSSAHRAGIHLSDEDLVTVKARCAAGIKVLGMRFTHDVLVPAERFDTLRRELGSGFEAIEIDSAPGNPWNIPRIAHSVVAHDFVDRDGHPTKLALERVLSFFREKLIQPAQSDLNRS